MERLAVSATGTSRGQLISMAWNYAHKFQTIKRRWNVVTKETGYFEDVFAQKYEVIKQMRDFRCKVRLGLMRLVLIYLGALATTTGTATTTPKLKKLIGRVRKNRGELHVWRALWNNSVLYSTKEQREMTT